LNPSGDPFDNQPGNLLGYPYQFLGPVLQCSLITLLRDTVTCCGHGESWILEKISTVFHSKRVELLILDIFEP